MKKSIYTKKQGVAEAVNEELIHQAIPKPWQNEQLINIFEQMVGTISRVFQRSTSGRPLKLLNPDEKQPSRPPASAGNRLPAILVLAGYAQIWEKGTLKAS